MHEGCVSNISNCNIRVENIFIGNKDVAMQCLYPNRPPKTVSFKNPKPATSCCATT